MPNENEVKYLSFSSIKLFSECQHKWKLKYIDGISGFEGNEYTIFGTAIHKAIEYKIKDETVDEVKIFTETLEEEYNKLSVKSDKINIKEFEEQGKKLVVNVIPSLKSHFGNFKLIAAEKELLKEIEIKNYGFKGYVDLIIEDEEGNVCILDMKTCTWGWDAQKKADTMTNYQLAYYKHFYSAIHNVDPSKIKTYFVLLKRTAKTNQVEIVDRPTGAVKVKNSLKVLNNCANIIESKTFWKNKLSCGNCSYYKKECK